MIVRINSWMWINSWCSRSFSCLHHSVKEWFSMITLNLWILFWSKVRYRSSDSFKGHCIFRIHNQGCLYLRFSIFQLHEECLVPILLLVLQSAVVQQVSSFNHTSETRGSCHSTVDNLHETTQEFYSKPNWNRPSDLLCFHLRPSFLSLEVMCALKS